MLNLVLFAPQLLESKFGWCSFCHWWAKPIPDHQVCLPCCHGFALVARVSSENSPAGTYEIHLEHIHISKFQFYTKQPPRAVTRSSLCLNVLNSLELYQFITWEGGGSVFQKQLSVLKCHCLFAVLSCIFSELFHFPLSSPVPALPCMFSVKSASLSRYLCFMVLWPIRLWRGFGSIIATR